MIFFFTNFAVAAEVVCAAVHHEIWCKSQSDLSNFSDFLSQKFLDHDNSSDRSKYHFKTTATDTTLVSKVIDSVQTIVINTILKEVGLMN